MSVLQNNGPLTLKELNAKYKECDLSDGQEMSRTTFFRLRDEIQSIFGVIIECNNNNGHKYYIYNEDELRCPINCSKECKGCPYASMTGDVFLCPRKHCFFAKIYI